MKLWTIQHPRVLDELRRTGRFRATWERCMGNDPEWGENLTIAYRWIVAEFNERMDCSVEAPIWFLLARPGSERRIPVAWERPCVRMEFEVPDEDVLVLSMERWVAVVMNNDWHIPDEVLEQPFLAWAAWETAQEAAGLSKQDTWSAIFDVINGERLQAITAELKLEQLVSYASFR